MATARRSIGTLLVLGVALATAGLAGAANPVSGSIFGPVVSASGKTFVVQTTLSPTGKSTVSVTSATVITESATATRADLRSGVCVVANGTKGKDGAVAAVRVSISQPVKGTCADGVGGGQRGTPPAGSRQRPPSGNRPPGARPSGSFGFAFGAVSAVKGSTLTVHGRSGTTKVTVSKSTQISKTVRVASSAISAKSCAFVRGTSADGGKTVKAHEVGISKPTSAGCTRGFAGRPGP